MCPLIPPSRLVDLARLRWGLRAALVAVAVGGLSACAVAPRFDALPPTGAGTRAPVTALAASASAEASVGLTPTAPAPAWQAFTLPGKRKTVYREVQVDGRSALHAQADESASMWRRPVQVPAADLGRLRFSWKVPQLIEGADLSIRDGEDSPVRIVLAFAGDHARLPLRDRLMFDLAETLTGERPPYATLMYVWDNRAPVDSVIHAARTDRVRKLVVESGPHHCQRWLAYERDVVADYRRLFGEEPGQLIGVAVMTDSDNTESRTEAYYGRIELLGHAGQPLF